jgi:hypothetical protein
MSDEHNPLIPVGYDVVWSLITVVVIALAIVALITLARAAKHLSGRQALGWTAFALLVPVLGPIAWLAVGRRTVGASPIK